MDRARIGSEVAALSRSARERIERGSEVAALSRSARERIERGSEVAALSRSARERLVLQQLLRRAGVGAVGEAFQILGRDGTGGGRAAQLVDQDHLTSKRLRGVGSARALRHVALVPFQRGL